MRRKIKRLLVKILALVFIITSFNFGVMVNDAGAASQLIWQIGTANDSFAEFAAIPSSSGAQSFTAPVSAGSFPAGQKASTNRTVSISYNLNSVPQYGLLFTFKLLNATQYVPELAVFSNNTLAGLIQLWGTNGTPVESTHKWKKTYQLYIPKEMLTTGTNVLKLEASRQLNCSSSLDQYLWWNWDYLKLEAPDTPAREPIHGKLTYIGTNITVGDGDFGIDADQLAVTPYLLKWLGIAYSGNTIRATFWKDCDDLQLNRLQYLQLLRDYNMTVMMDYIASNHFNNDASGNMPQTTKNQLNSFFSAYGSLFQYYETENEPGLCNNNGGGVFAEIINLCNYINSIKPGHVLTVAPGWDYSSNGAEVPVGWQKDPAQRRIIENLCQATNGHAYGQSFNGDEGSFVENLRTFGNLSDGWGRPFINSEMGVHYTHTDYSVAGSNKTHDTAFDRIMRGYVAVGDRFMVHAANWGEFSLINPPNTSNLPGSLTAYNPNNEDGYLKAYRRSALAYATHGTPLPYTYANQSAIAGKKVYFRPVDTSTLDALPGSGGKSDKILLNFVNFESTPQTMSVNVTMPVSGTYTGERFGAGNSYNASRSTVSLNASPSVSITETLQPGDSVQYILTIPSGGSVINYVSNPGFENGTANWSCTWTDTSASYVESYGGAHSGTYHLTHYKDTPYTVYTSQLVTGLPNGTYTAKAWVKSSGGQAYGHMEAIEYGGQNLTAAYNMQIDNWTQITIPNINVTNGQCRVGFYSQAQAHGMVYMDDVELIRTQPYVANYVANPGFEDGTANWSCTWTDTSASYVESYGGAHSGTYHLTHYKDTPYAVYTSQLITGLPNGTYTAKAWVKSSGGQAYGHMEAIEYGGANLQAPYNMTLNNWTQITIPNINVTNGQCRIGFYSQAQAHGMVYMDDVELVRN